MRTDHNQAAPALVDFVRRSGGLVDVPSVTAQQVRAELLTRREIALLDVREEDEFARSHPLWAANLSLNRLELDAWARIPRRDTPLVVYGACASSATPTSA